MELIIVAVVSIVIAGLAGFVVGRAQLQSRCAVLKVQLEQERALSTERQADEERLLATVQMMSKATIEDAADRLTKTAEATLKLANADAKGELDQQRLTIEHLIKPVQDNLAKLEHHINESERARKQEYGGLFQQMQSVAETNLQVKAEAVQLKNVLKSSTSQRGRWGEVQLRRVVELAGMSSHCDFTEQSSITNDAKRSRADLIVMLPGDMKIAVDAKVPFDAYEQGCTADDPAVQRQWFTEHAKRFRSHVDELARRAYWNEYTPSCGFTVLFVPGEALLDAALSSDPDLWEHANSKQILLATPSTLIALLRMAAVGWLQQQQTANVVEVTKVGKELYTRLTKLGTHVDKLGRSLRGAVGSYNDFVGSLEKRVLPSAKKLNDCGMGDGTMIELEEVTDTPRSIHHEALRASIVAVEVHELVEGEAETA